MIEKRRRDVILIPSPSPQARKLSIVRLIDGIAMSHKDDDARLIAAAEVFDDLHAYFPRKARG